MRMSCVLKKSHFQIYYGNCNEFTCSPPCWAPQPPDSNTVCSDAVLGSDLTVLSVQVWNVNVCANLLSQARSQWACAAGHGAEVPTFCSQTRKSKTYHVMLQVSVVCLVQGVDEEFYYSLHKIKSSHKKYFSLLIIERGKNHFCPKLNWGLFKYMHHNALSP